MMTLPQVQTDHPPGEDLIRFRNGRNRRSRFVEAGAVTGFFVAFAVFVYLRQRDSGYRWNFAVVVEYLPALARGLGITLMLTAICIVTSAILGIFVASARMSKIPSLQIASTLYIEVMRTTPLLVIIVWSYYVVPILVNVNLSAYATGILALTLYSGAVFAETFRSGVQSVSIDQRECAALLGLSKFNIQRLVILPQAIKNMIPVLVTSMLLTFKETTLVAFIGINDLMRVGTLISTTTFRSLEVLSTVGLIYFAVGLPMTLIARSYERRLGRRHGQIIA